MKHPRMIWQKLLLPTLLAVALQPASLSAQGNARPFAFGQAQQQIEASSVVQWSHTLSDSGLVFQAAVKRPWHLYDIDLPQGGPTSTEFVLEEI